MSDKELEKIWEQLEDVPFIENENKEPVLDEDFYDFKKGTTREEIWHYFDENHSKGIYYLLYQYESVKDENIEKYEFYKTMYKNELDEAQKTIEFYGNENGETDFTLKEVAQKYSIELANIMFECGYASWYFKDLGSLEDMKNEMIQTIEDDYDLQIKDKQNPSKEEIIEKIKNVSNSVAEIEKEFEDEEEDCL